MPRNNHNGTTLRIRELLEKSPRPMRQKEIAAALNVDLKQVTSALCAMLDRLGGACNAGKDGVYNLYGVPGRDDVKKSKPSPNVAGPRYEPPHGVLRRDPYAGMRLALDGPR